MSDGSEAPRSGVDMVDIMQRPVGVPKPDADTMEHTRQAILGALLAERKTLVREKRLLSSSGLTEIARELNVTFEGQGPLSQSNVAAFLKACGNSIGRKNYLLYVALHFLAFGTLAIESNELPCHTENEFDDPIQAYLGALEFIDNFLDSRRTEKPGAAPDGNRVDRFLERRYRADWQRACRAAAQVEAQTISRLRDKHGREIVTGDKADTFLILHDSAGKPIGSFSTFQADTVALKDDQELRNRNLPVTSSAATSAFYKKVIQAGRQLLSGHATDEPEEPQTPEGNFIDGLFPVSEYPDREKLMETPVEHIVGVIPLPSQRPEIFFEIAFDGGTEPYEVEVVTGEGWHTDGNMFVNRRGGKATIGIPSSMGSGHEEFFSARASGILGEKRQELAAAQKEQASTSVILVLKPVISQAKVDFRKGVIRFRQGEVDMKGLVNLAVDNEAADSAFELQNAGFFTEEEAHQFLDGLTQAREARRQELEAQERFQREHSGLASGGSLFRGDPLSLRAGSKGGVGAGEFLHTGSSGVGTGARYGTFSESLSPDPFARPKILVITPFGIQAQEEQDEDGIAERIAEVVNIRAN